jgi:hypothetical protein
MPRIDDILDLLGSATVFSKIDLKWGFYNIELHEADKEKTAFSLKSGHYEWNVLPMGLKNSPATFQRIMTALLKPYIGVFLHVFIDDIIIFSKSPTEHLKHIEMVLDILSLNGFKISIAKSQFGLSEIDYLGFTVTGDGVRPKKEQIAAIKKMPCPKDLKELRSFTGMVNFFRWMIPKFADVIAPLEDLKKKGKTVEGD